MKRPEKPPTLRSLLDRASKLDAEKLGQLFLYRDLAPGGRYLHWDKVRRTEPPRGLSPEEWWTAIKLGRSAAMRELPLLGTDGRPFAYALADPLLEQIPKIERALSGTVAISEPGVLTSPQTREQYLVSSLFEESITSSQIEGAVTTRRAAKAMLRSGRAPKNHDERMIVNNYRAMLFTRELRNKPLTPEHVRELHQIVTDGTLDNPDSAGELRTMDDVVVWDHEEQSALHVPPQHEELPERLKLMCDFANGKIPGRYVPPAVRAILLHFWLAYDHPFVDGNGRTARALFYWSMLSQGYWLCEFISISSAIKKAKTKYNRSFLYAESDENDVTYFVLTQMQFIEQSIEGLNRYIEKKAKEQSSILQQLKKSSAELNHRQIALLTAAVRDPSEEFTIEGHQKSHGVAYQTARSDLMALEELGLLRKRKLVGKRLSFFAVDGLSSKLSRLK